MNTSTSKNKLTQFEVLDQSANILTGVLTVVFGIITRIEACSSIIYVFYVLVLLFAINALLSIFLFYKNRVLKPPNYSKNNFRLGLRIAANIGFAALSYSFLIF